MLLKPTTPEDLRRNFGRVLNDILDGTIDLAPEGNGLDDQTNDALNAVAANRGGGGVLDRRAQFTLAAYEEFGRQLSGEHSRQAVKALGAQG